MIGLTLVLLGLLLGASAWLLLRRGRAWRVGRLLSGAPQRSLAEAVALARRGEVAYVRVHGRVDSAEEFPGAAGMPVVYRRRRLFRGAGPAGPMGRQTLDDERLAVAFGLVERGERLAIASDDLGDGLVVVPRVSTGVAADLAGLPEGAQLPPLPPQTTVSLHIEQVASIDHATACGVPRLSAGDEVVLGAGLGRPLVLTTLALDEAMRVLGSERGRALPVATVLLVAAPLAIVVGVLLAVLGW